jgi:amidohydrolase
MSLISAAEHDLIRAIAGEAAVWRQTIHSQPEVLYDLPKTSAFVAARLAEFGCDEVVEGLGGCGVVGVIRGQEPGPRVTALRAEMDALPIVEETGLPYASTHPGKMHACGHDGHTATLLATAKFLCATRAFAGTAIVLFQPAEEGGAGAKAMIDDGVIERFGIERIFALHNLPGLPVGSFATRPGTVMSASDRFVINIKGKGGHAAMPHKANDPIACAANLVNAINAMVSRYCDPLEPVVLSVNSIHGGEAFNVIPEHVEMRGSLRTITQATRNDCKLRLDRLCSGMGEALDLDIELTHIPIYAPTVNEPATATEVLRTLADEIGADRVQVSDVMMGAEDFSFFLETLPGCFVWYGNGDTPSLHNPRFDFSDAAIEHGARALVTLLRSGAGVAAVPQA